MKNFSRPPKIFLSITLQTRQPLETGSQCKKAQIYLNNLLRSWIFITAIKLQIKYSKTTSILFPLSEEKIIYRELLTNLLSEKKISLKVLNSFSMETHKEKGKWVNKKGFSLTLTNFIYSPTSCYISPRFTHKIFKLYRAKAPY